MEPEDSSASQIDWDHVDQGERKLVGRLARHGRVHPDAQIAAAAVEHANSLNGADALWRKERWHRRFIRILDINTLFFDTGFGDWLEDRADRRWAKRVLEADRRHQGKAGG